MRAAILRRSRLYTSAFWRLAPAAVGYNRGMALSSTAGTRIAGVALALLALVAGAFLQKHRSQADPAAAAAVGALWPPPPSLAPFALTDASGAAFGPDRLQGRWSLVFFGFTHCPDVCPTTLAALGTAMGRLREAAGGDAWQVVFVSVDPTRDTPEAIGRYVSGFGPGVTGVTGSDDALAALTRQLGVVYMRVGDGEDYQVDHSAQVLMLDPQARLVGVLSPPHAGSAIAERARAIRDFIEDRS